MHSNDATFFLGLPGSTDNPRAFGATPFFKGESESDLQNASSDVTRAVFLVEIIRHQNTPVFHQRCPRVPQIARAPILAQHNLRRRGGIGAFRIQYARPDAKGWWRYP